VLRLDMLLARSKAAFTFLDFVRSFWTGRHAFFAWGMTTLLAVLILGGVWLQATINRWNAAFFDALEQKAGDDLPDLLVRFAMLVLGAGLIVVLTVFVRMMLQVRIRAFISRRIVSLWLHDDRHRRIDHGQRGAQTPEFRISDDVRLGVDLLFDLAVGFTSCVLLAVTFFEVLARVGGSLTLPGSGITIPVYFLFGAIFYACVMSGLAWLVGWSLMSQISNKNHHEGVFRYQLTRVREPDRSTLGTTGSQDRAIIVLALDELVGAWRRVMVGQSRVSGIASANAVLVGVFPVLLATPKYISGEMSLGAVMQLATAFVQVQMALNWIVDNFVRFAEWQASASRVGEFVHAIEAVDRPTPDAAGETPDLGQGAYAIGE
jgi:putative ATP-binding cassette transporter